MKALLLLLVIYFASSCAVSEGNQEKIVRCAGYEGHLIPFQNGSDDQRYYASNLGLAFTEEMLRRRPDGFNSRITISDLARSYNGQMEDDQYEELFLEGNALARDHYYARDVRAAAEFYVDCTDLFLQMSP